jgi:small subunit ribosomal protein S10
VIALLVYYILIIGMSTTLRIASNSKLILSRTEKSLTKLFQEYEVDYHIIGLPLKITKYTVLRSPHIDKKSRDQLERRSYVKLIVIDLDLSYQPHNLFLEHLLKYVPAGVGITFRTTESQQ